MASDRDGSVQLNNILSDPQFSIIWVPENKGDNDSWGELLNENWETIVRTFVVIDERIVSNTNDIVAANLLATNANTISLLNQSALVTLNGVVAALSVTVSSNDAEVTAARGSLSTLDDRLDVSLNEDGTPKASVTMSGIFTTNYLQKDITYNTTTNNLNITSEVTGEALSDGSDYGIIGVAKGSNTEADNIVQVYVSGTPHFNPIGNRVYGRSVKSVNDLYLRTFYLDDNGVEQNHTITSGQLIKAFIPKMFDVSTTPAIDLIQNEVFNFPKSTELDYGMVKSGIGSGLDADTVDTIHASTIPQGDHLLALNTSARFDSSVIEINDVIDGVNTLQTYYPKLLQNRIGEIYKTINDYIGPMGGELFAKVAVSGIAGSIVDDFGGQFTRSISDIESDIDNNIFNITNNDIGINNNTALINIINGTTIPGVISSYQAADQAIINSFILTTSGNLDIHTADANAHHPADSSGIIINSAGVFSPFVKSADIQGTVAAFTNVNAVNASIDNLTVTTFNNNLAANSVYYDKFIELGYVDPSGNVVVNNPITTSGIPIIDEYSVGMMLHHPDITKVSGLVTGYTDRASLLRYNKVTETLEFTENWVPPTAIDAINDIWDDSANDWVDVMAPSQTAVVNNFQTVTNVLGGSPTGKYTVREGIYTEDLVVSNQLTIEGVGYATHINGTVHVSGVNIILKEIRADAIYIHPGSQKCMVINNYVTGGVANITDDSGEINNLIFGNLEA